jgi:hypothetical protein
MMKLSAAVLMLAACGGSPEQTGAASAADEASAVAACQAANGNTCAIVPSCGADSMVTTFGGNSAAGIPIHPDELDGWVYAGPHAQMTVKFVTSTIAGVIHPAAYACTTLATAPTLVVTGSW